MCVRSLIVASAFVVAFFGISGTALAQSDTFSPNTDRFGSDFRNIAINGDAKACMSLCVRESQCRAWTFVKAGIQGPSARCFLKNPAPAPSPNPCCTSGIKRLLD
jgi:PAN domain